MLFALDPVIFNREKRLFVLIFIFVDVNIGPISWSLRNDFFGPLNNIVPTNYLWEVGDHLVIGVTLVLLNNYLTSLQLLIFQEFSLKLLPRERVFCPPINACQFVV